MRKKLLLTLVAFALALCVPFTPAWASGDLDEILDYQITVDVNDDATLDMVYHIDWKVLDSTSEGPLSWVRVGIPNYHYVEMESLSDTINDIDYSSSDGSFARIDFDRNYHAGEVVSFDFRIVQDYMYEVGRDNEGEAVYEFTPGWFDDVAVDKLTVRWNDEKVARIAPAAQQDGGYYTWSTSLAKGERYTVTVGYPDDAFDFNINQYIESSDADDYDYDYDDYEDDSDSLGAIIGVLIALVWCGGLMWWLISAVLGAARSVASLFSRDSGFTTGKKITRTKVVYYPVCEGCGAARPEGKDTCEYCGRSFIKSQETVTEQDIPAAEKAIKGKSTEGEYAYSTEPNTFLRVHVVPVPVSAASRGHHRGGSSGRSGSSHSCACASSCACACGCACACACAGGGRAGCTTKDFYNTDLKLSQLE